MDTQDFDKIFLELRNSPPSAPARLAGNVISKLGPPAESLRTLFLTGVLACLTGIVVSAVISLGVVREKPGTAPPELT
ncbi:MAG TPA: hypothetical protein PK529_06685, partial [Verrucomicrobiales bacterium]|nr:hypothetical protein [Verrucomicrobiales bacterium]